MLLLVLIQDDDEDEDEDEQAAPAVAAADLDAMLQSTTVAQIYRFLVSWGSLLKTSISMQAKC